MDIDEIIRRGKGLPPSGPPQVTVSAPINDVQLICLMASHLYQRHNPSDFHAAVDDAIHLMAEAVARAAAGDVIRIIDEARERNSPAA